MERSLFIALLDDDDERPFGDPLRGYIESAFVDRQGSMITVGANDLLPLVERAMNLRVNDGELRKLAEDLEWFGDGAVVLRWPTSTEFS